MAKPNRANQGQVLIVAALVIVIMLLSTAMYIADIQKTQLRAQTETDLNLPFYKQGIQHTMINALVNISDGGDTGVLLSNLEGFNTFVEAQSFGAFFTSDVTLQDDALYDNGVWLSQNQSGTAVIGAYAGFNVESSGTNGKIQSAFSLNVTSMLQAQGVYSIDNSSKQAQLTCKIFNEGQSALAENFSVSVETDGLLAYENWTLVEAPNITDYGDGTYLITFNALTEQPENPLLVWLTCQDQRGITLQTIVEPSLQ
ncbi:MAG: hypothetical protein ACFCUE_10040 [Candidatus Bathyarchaeia archaeon]|jgi:hypothetical protein